MGLAGIKEDVKDYIKTQVDVVKLKIAAKLEKVIANAIVAAALAVIGLFVLLFLSLAGAYAISTASDRPYLGFLVVGGFYAIIAVAIVALKEKLLNAPIMNSLLTKLKYKKED